MTDPAAEGRRLLVLHPGALGDVVTAFPALEGLRRRYSEIHLLCGGAVGELARHLAVADRAHPMESALFSGLYSGSPAPRLVDLLRGFDAMVALTFSEPPVETMARTANRPVFRVAPRPAPGERIHVADHLLRELLERGLITPGDGAGVRPTDRRSPSADPLRVVLHPGSGSPKKNWPLPRFVSVHRLLEEKGFSPEVILGPAESDLEADLYTRIGPEAEIRRFQDLVALAEYLRTAGGYIGNDAGVTHLAAYLGLPTLAVFGPSDPARWRPAGPTVAVAGPGIPCDPCFEKGAEPDCPGKGTTPPPCLGDTPAGLVAEAFLVLHKNGEPPCFLPKHSAVDQPAGI